MPADVERSCDQCGDPADRALLVHLMDIVTCFACGPCAAEAKEMVSLTIFIQDVSLVEGMVSEIMEDGLDGKKVLQAIFFSGRAVRRLGG